MNRSGTVSEREGEDTVRVTGASLDLVRPRRGKPSTRATLRLRLRPTRTPPAPETSQLRRLSSESQDECSETGAAHADTGSDHSHCAVTPTLVTVVHYCERRL